MLPHQHIKGANAETVGIVAIIGVLTVPALMIAQIVKKGAADTVERAAWWPLFIFAEAFFLAALAIAWRWRRRER